MIMFGLSVLMSVHTLVAVVRILLSFMFFIGAFTITSLIATKLKKVKANRKDVKHQIRNTPQKNMLDSTMDDTKENKFTKSKSKKKKKTTSNNHSIQETFSGEEKEQNKMNYNECSWSLISGNKQIFVLKDLEKFNTTDKIIKKVTFKYPKSNVGDEFLLGPTSIINQKLLPNWLDYQMTSKSIYPVEIVQGNEKIVLTNNIETKEYKTSLEKLYKKQRPIYINNLPQNSKNSSASGEREQ